jgi:tryptophanyl-tRNA synthetase
MSISTDSTPLEDPKNPESCTVFKLYSLMANADKIDLLKNKYSKVRTCPSFTSRSGVKYFKDIKTKPDIDLKQIA